MAGNVLKDISASAVPKYPWTAIL